MILEPWLEQYIPASGEVFIDIGANVGTWTKALAPRFKWVHAIEPFPLEALKRDLPAHVSVHEWAAWDKQTELRFAVYPDCTHNSSIFTHNPDLCFMHTFPARRIDSLIMHASFVKCDCEGAEVEAITGMSKIIESDHPTMIIEIHLFSSYIQLQELLASWGYGCLKIEHPYYDRSHRLYGEHFWIYCTPL